MQSQDFFRQKAVSGGRIAFMSILSLTPEIEALLSECMSQGGFTSPEDAILAGLASLRSQQHSGEFGAGELDEILLRAEMRLKQEGPVSPEQTRHAIGQMSELHRKRA